jgi:thiol reductant ABC exporter CydC subunit
MITFRRMLPFLAPYKWRALAAAILGFLAIGTNIGLMGTSGYLIASAALRPETILLLWVPIVGVRFFGLSRAVFRYLERLVSHDLTFRVLARIRVWLYARLEPQAPQLLESRRSGDILSSVVSDVEQMQNFYLRVLAPPVIALLTAVLGYSILAGYDRALGLLLVGMMILGGAILPWLNHRMSLRAGNEIVEVRAKLYTESTDLIAGLSELLLYGRMEDAIATWEVNQKRLNQLQTRHHRLGAFFGGLMVLITNMAMWMALVITIGLTATHQLNGIAIPTVILVVIASFEAVSPLPLAFQQWSQTKASADRLFQLADSTPSIEHKDKPQQLEATASQELNVRNLHFRYTDKEKEVLRGVDFTLTPGKHIAVVGESGAGKSSIMQVLLKLRPYQTGSIQLFGSELSRLSETWVREQFAVVSQDTYLFNTTAAENLRLGKPDATMAELEAAARTAQLHDWIAKLPEGYETIVGEWGTRLSGGERQRLSLARALLRQAPIVLFDEPTTGLDSLTEKAFLASAQAALQGRAVLWITHRLIGLEAMDEILVLRNGELNERGKHQVLLDSKGYYSQLLKLQEEQMLWTQIPGEPLK